MRRLAAIVFTVLAFAASAEIAPSGPYTFQLKFTENFNGSELNPKLWRRIEGFPGMGADWRKNMSLREDLVEVKGGILTLKGVRNDDTSADPRRLLTGGITTDGLFGMKYGKLEARIRLVAKKGAWPAFWMMPVSSPNGWPNDGEIDILERLNFDPFVYHTVHSAWTKKSPGDPPSSGKGKIKPDAWNVYALEWTPDSLVWKINGRAMHKYRKTLNADHERWPWDAPFYVMLDMQLGGKWVGEVDEDALPAIMQVDWVKFYQLSQGSKRISEFSRPNR